MINKEWLQEKEACKKGVDWFLQKFGEENKKPVEVLKDLIADNKLEWTNWLIVRIMERKQYLAYAIYPAEQVIDIFEKKYPDDNRPRLAIEAAKKVLDNDTKENRDAAGDAALAALAARAARADDWAAADDAADDAADAARSAARSAADDAADAARSAARAAAWAARASGAAGDAMRIKILNYGIKLLERIEC